MIEIIIMGLGAWRLTLMITVEDGPFNIFRRLRESTGVSHHDDGNIANIPDKITSKFVTCSWCVGLWMAAMMYAVLHFVPILAYILAVAALVIILERIRQ